MFKGLVGRQALLCRVPGLRSVALPIARNAIQPAKKQWAVRSVIASQRCYTSSSPRLQQSAAAAAPVQEAVSGQDVTQFTQLPQLGVHPNVVRAITDGMGYRDMTDVQSKTINPAMTGTDLYVAP